MQFQPPHWLDTEPSTRHNVFRVERARLPPPWANRYLRRQDARGRPGERTVQHGRCRPAAPRGVSRPHYCRRRVSRIHDMPQVLPGPRVGKCKPSCHHRRPAGKVRADHRRAHPRTGRWVRGPQSPAASSRRGDRFAGQRSYSTVLRCGNSNHWYRRSNRRAFGGRRGSRSMDRPTRITRLPQPPPPDEPACRRETLRQMQVPNRSTRLLPRRTGRRRAGRPDRRRGTGAAGAQRPARR